jgi:hypothetical protein
MGFLSDSTDSEALIYGEEDPEYGFHFSYGPYSQNGYFLYFKSFGV